MRDACYDEQRCLAFLMSADATGVTLEPGPMVLGCDGRNGLTAKGKVSIQRRSGVASGQYTGRGARGRGREQASEAEGDSGSQADGVTWSILVDSV